MKLDKRDCFERAKTLISESDSFSLRYAALELRCCIEAITYDKLANSSTRIPQSILNKWQPPQAIKALAEFEPDTDKGFIIAVGIEDEPGKRSKNMHYLGEHKTFSWKWLKKHYNKLGNFLHFPTLEQQKTIQTDEEIRTYLLEALSHVEEILQGNILGGWMGEIYQFECSICHEMIVGSKHKVETSKTIQCLNPQCEAEYYAEFNTDSLPVFHLKASNFDCFECKEKIQIENRKLNIGLQFKCQNCGTLHEIVNRQWGYGKVDDNQ